jgi:farnesol dehydrogenase
MKALVTGAGGYVASRLAMLLAESGMPVRAMYRSKRDVALNHPNIEWVQGELGTDPSSMKRFVAGCTQLYHPAAYASNWAKPNDIFYAMNVEMPLALFEVAFQSGIEKVVFTSSAGVIGPSPNGLPVNEKTMRQTPFFGDYEKSKAQAEERILALIEKENYNIAIVNPTRIYGPGVRGKSNSVTEIIEKYIHGQWKIRLGSGNEIANYVFVDDVAQGHILAMAHGKTGERYLLGGEDISFNHFIELISEISVVHQKLTSVPFGVLGAYTRVEDWLADTFGIAPKITHNWVEKLKSNWSTDITKARTELGYSPRSLKQGITETINWLNNT